MASKWDVTPALRSHVETRFERLARHFEGDCEIRVQLALEKPLHKAIATINVAGRTLHGDAVGPDMYDGHPGGQADRQLIKHKENSWNNARVMVWPRVRIPSEHWPVSTGRLREHHADYRQ